MYRRLNAVWLTFGVVSFCIIRALAAKPQANVVKPVGPRMCERLCKRTIGCSKYTYVIGDLSCQLIDINKEDFATGKYVVKAIKGRQKKNGDDGMKQCRRNDIKFRSRRHQAVCRPQGAKHMERRPEKPTRLLMFPYGRTLQPAPKQLFLCNRSVVSCPCLGKDIPWYRAVAYISVSKQIAVATHDSFFFISMNDKCMKKVIWENSAMSIRALAVDELKQIMFFISHIMDSRLYNMTTEGANPTFIRRLPWGAPADIAADPKRSLIYIMFSQSRILKFTHSGFELETVITQSFKIVSSMVVDSERDSLFFTTTNPVAVNQISLESGKFVKIRKLGLMSVYCSFVWRSNVYAMPKPFYGKLLIVSENGSITEIQTSFTQSLRAILFGGIP